MPEVIKEKQLVKAVKPATTAIASLKNRGLIIANHENINKGTSKNFPNLWQKVYGKIKTRSRKRETEMNQITIFAEETRLPKLSEPGDCLEKIRGDRLGDISHRAMVKPSSKSTTEELLRGFPKSRHQTMFRMPKQYGCSRIH